MDRDAQIEQLERELRASFPFGAILLDELVERGWSFEYLELQTGVPADTWSRMVTDPSLLTPERAELLALALGVSVEMLVGLASTSATGDDAYREFVSQERTRYGGGE